ncbi:MAG: histidine phosphatase family protein [Anaerolineae bacterium]|nr:histidine phosphatase family protein [Anaerolineae bacterium]
MTELWLVRHGQTNWNVEKRYQGQSDIPLNAKGIEEASLLGRNIEHERFAAIYSSDLIRARQTAEILAKERNMLVNTDVRLREFFHGRWEGRVVNDVRADYADQNDEEFKLTQLRPPGGERIFDLANRFQAALNDITLLFPGEKVLVVTHGLAIATLVCMKNGLPFNEVYSQIPRNARELIMPWNAGDFLHGFERKN